MQGFSDFFRALLGECTPYLASGTGALQEAEGRTGLTDGSEVTREARDTDRGDPRCPDRLPLLAFLRPDARHADKLRELSEIMLLHGFTVRHAHAKKADPRRQRQQGPTGCQCRVRSQHGYVLEVYHRSGDSTICPGMPLATCFPVSLPLRGQSNMTCRRQLPQKCNPTAIGARRAIDEIPVGTCQALFPLGIRASPPVFVQRSGVLLEERRRIEIFGRGPSLVTPTEPSPPFGPTPLARGTREPHLHLPWKRHGAIDFCLRDRLQAIAPARRAPVHVDHPGKTAAITRSVFVCLRLVLWPAHLATCDVTKRGVAFCNPHLIAT
jgi:hypothetical protein